MAVMFAVPAGVRHASLPPAHLAMENSVAAESSARTASPDVAHRLREACGGDERTVSEMLARLSREQQRGLRSLPDPLPLVPTVEALGRSVVLATWEREALQIAAVCIDDRLETLLAVIDHGIDDVLNGPLSSQFALVAGRFSFRDPRMRIWAHESATLAERTRVHERLAQHYAQIGDARRSLWHRALSTMQGNPALAAPLLALCTDAVRAGNENWAYAVAREAASHADASEINRARVAAGLCALGAGWLDDALDWLRPVIASDDHGAIADALPSFVVASTIRHGCVPSADLIQQRPEVNSDRRWPAFGRAASLAAALSAERGHTAESRSWFAAAREADARLGRQSPLTLAAAGWSALFTGEVREGEASEKPAGPEWWLCAALRLGLEGDAEAGLRLLAGNERVSGRTEDTPIVGGERSRLVRAHRAVADAILRVWNGDLRAAKTGLEEAALHVPLALAFDGIAVFLARRIELAVDGQCGELSAALAAANPGIARGGELSDQGLEAYLKGDSDHAATLMRLWLERGAPRPALALPALDEIGPIDLPTTVLAPPDVLRAQILRHRIRTDRGNAWEQDYREVAAESCEIVSPFERARVEALLGTAYATRGDRAAGMRHLRTARTLFSVAGANGWTHSVDERLARLGEQLSDVSGPPTAPIPVPADPLWVCRGSWEPLLTERELSVAMLVADGRTNREIAERLFVSVRTVEVHIGRMFTKLGVRSRGELIALAHRTNQLI
ncbi:MAG: LuxR C-terminal-related transcriptional regulator [Microbacterium sp.]|uniref:LuxR C-terminal-related transcriptional regulator n=1 Tax=Microbacterium sp. TaxID=51671 RepID=UPI003F9C6CAA